MDEELLECNANQVFSEPDEGAVMCPPPARSSETPAPVSHLDDATGDLLGDHPPGWGVLLDPEAPAGPVFEPEAPEEAEPAPTPAPSTGPSIGPATGPIGQVPSRQPVSSSPTLREAARRDASEDAFDWRVGEQGPYVYGENVEGDGFHPGGTTFGFGVAHNPSSRDGGDALNAHFGAGQWRDQDGEEYEGIRFNGGVLSGTGEYEDDIADRMDIGVGTFDFGAYSTDETFTMGAQANAGEIAGTWGDEHGSTGSDTDSNLRVGGSAGGGLALRLHYGDADGDNIRERGFGFDAGPVSLDLRSEYLGRAWDSVFGD